MAVWSASSSLLRWGTKTQAGLEEIFSRFFKHMTIGTP